jgi:cytochrome c biogenesis protein ResB
MTGVESVVDEEERDRLRNIFERVAAANEETADAVTQAAPLAGTDRQAGDLWRIHRELTDAYSEIRRALDLVEHAIDDFDTSSGGRTPRSIKDTHAERLKELYDGPVLSLALLLLEQNRREWLHAKPQTNGAQAVENHGLTANQREWLDSLADASAGRDTGGDADAR